MILKFVQLLKCITLNTRRIKGTKRIRKRKLTANKSTEDITSLLSDLEIIKESGGISCNYRQTYGQASKKATILQ